MKKVLFATTALIATAGVASADITLTGGATIGFKDDGTAASNAYLHQELDFNIVASGMSDAGIGFGASMDLDEDSASADDEYYITGAFGTVTVGAVDTAADGVGLADLGFDGIGVDDDVEAIRNRGGADMNYAYSVNGLDIIISYAVGTTAAISADEGDWGVYLGYDFNGLKTEVSYTVDDSQTTYEDATGVELSYTVAGITLGALFADNGQYSGSGFSASYAMSPELTVTAVINNTDPATIGTNTDTHDDSGIGFAYNMGGGLTLSGAVGDVDNYSVAQLGLNMSF